ncbi:MAG: 50S ribosomal protein L27 [Candidatus Lernaella stagnicola]|nr:50S ribosomal protein L27 [Candidatus Lernaella stagnicola]
MAHKKAGGSSRNGRDSQGRRFGMKAQDGQFVTGGTIIIRQLGTLIHPGENVGMGRDYTLYAKIPGTVKICRWGRDRKRANIIPAEQAQTDK